MRINLTIRTNHARRHGGVRKDLLAREAVMLSLARCDDALSNNCRAICFGSSLTTQLAKLHGGYVDVNVDTIEERSGDATNITLDLSQRAAALTRGIIPEAARTGIHCS